MIVVEIDLNFQLLLVTKVLWVLNGDKAELVKGIRRVGDKLTNENFFVLIQRVNDDIHQSGNISVEGEFLITLFNVLKMLFIEIVSFEFRSFTRRIGVAH